MNKRLRKKLAKKYKGYKTMTTIQEEYRNSPEMLRLHHAAMRVLEQNMKDKEEAIKKMWEVLDNFKPNHENNEA